MGSTSVRGWLTSRRRKMKVAMKSSPKASTSKSRTCWILVDFLAEEDGQGCPEEERRIQAACSSALAHLLFSTSHILEFASRGASRHAEGVGPGKTRVAASSKNRLQNNSKHFQARPRLQ